MPASTGVLLHQMGCVPMLRPRGAGGDATHYPPNRHSPAHEVPDFIIAAVAQRARLTVLHYDRDFDLIAAHTGQPCEWVVPPGAIN